MKNFVRPLCKKQLFGKRFDSQHVKVFRILAKSPWKHFYHVFSSLSGKLIWKMSPLVLGWLLGVFVNTLTADGKILFKIVRIWNSQFKCKYLKNQKHFLNFLFHFLNLHEIWNILKKRMIVIARLFLKLETVKILLRPLSKERHFRARFDSQHVKASQILAKSWS